MPSSFIAEDLTLEGDIKSDEGSIEIEGNVIGNVTARSIVIRVGGSVRGALSAMTVIIEGKHAGKLNCDDLKLSSTARWQGEIMAKTMTSETGAEIEGKIHIAGKT